VAKELVRVAHISFRLLHCGHIEEHERLPQMMIGTEATDGAWRCAYDAPGLPYQAL
jgi:hypothetical protein